MKLIQVDPSELVISDELRRSGSAKQFEDRLQASIDEIGIAEPLKIAAIPTGGYLVVDGTLRLRAIQALREADPQRFTRVPAYLLEYERRFEIRYQTDIYQDLLPSQLATLVEHLHKTEKVKKTDIARYIGVAPTTLRNYTGVGRLMEQGGLSARIVDLMDVGVIPSSNPYAWLRLTQEGVAIALEQSFTDGAPAHEWIDTQVAAARAGNGRRFITSYVESATGELDPSYYRAGEEFRSVKRDLGLRRAINAPATQRASERAPASPAAKRRLSKVVRASPEPVLRAAARSLRDYLT